MTGSTIVNDTIPPDRELETEWSIKNKVRKAERFLKGPIPIHILHQASRLPGKALPLYLAIRHRCDLQRSNQVTLPSQYLFAWGIDRHAKRRALKVLREVGLIATDIQTGRSTRVTIV